MYHFPRTYVCAFSSLFHLTYNDLYFHSQSYLGYLYVYSTTVRYNGDCVLLKLKKIVHLNYDFKIQLLVDIPS